MDRVARFALLSSIPPLLLIVAKSAAICPSSPFPLGNVTWLFPDSLASCPAGDSIVFSHSALHPHPARLRIIVGYFDANCDPRVHVPPESIWVTFTGFTGTLKANDLAAKTYADDSTDAGGATRITIPSFSGSGNATVKLYVSGVSQGTKTVRVRTVDTNADGRVLGGDVIGMADINYDGAVNGNDASLAATHADHWNRNALHGALVRRTNLCENCAEDAANTKGEGQVFWSPSGRFISYTAFIDASALCPEEIPGQPAASCKVFIVPSDPREGNVRTQLTFEPICYHDYDPSWSPLDDQIVFDRGDSVIIATPVPWLGSGQETAITASNNPGCGNKHGDDIPAVSPDGQWVAFSRCVSPDPLGPGGWNLWKIPIVGGTAVQLTPATGATDFYVSWSPDGQTIYFQRQEPGNDQIQAWKVPAAGGTAERVFLPSSSPDLFDAVQPGSSPDGALLVFGHGKRDGVTRNVVAHTLDPEIPSPTPAKVVANYQDTTFAAKGDFPILSPRLSPDGTRLALGSKQVWAGRRNMNLPPAFTSVTSTNEGRRSIADTAATMAFTFDPAILNTVTVLASDPEGDALSFLANFLPTWMSWNPTNRTLSGDPPIGTLGKTFYIKFWVTTPSGGTDAFVAIITVPSTLVPSAARRLAGEGSNVLGPNPTRGTFSVSTSANGGVVARLTVYDLAGRRVAAVHGPSGEALVWNGRDRKGALVPAGVYLWRLEVAERRQEGRLVVVR